MTEMTDEEQRAEEERVEAAEVATIKQGMAPLKRAKQDAQADQATADNLRAEAQGLTTDLQTLKGQIDGFTASATYSPQQMNQMRNMLSQVVASQIKVTQALAEGYTYRKGNNQSVVATVTSVLYLFRRFFNEQ